MQVNCISSTLRTHHSTESNGSLLTEGEIKRMQTAYAILVRLELQLPQHSWCLHNLRFEHHWHNYLL